MKKLLLVLTVVAMASLLFVGCFGTTPPPDVVVNIAAIPGVTAPVTGATPVAAITATAQYTGTVVWSGTPATFAASTAYTATITLTPTTGYTLTGVLVDFFTVAGATATNLADSGDVTAVFPATAAAPVTPVAPTITDIPGQVVYWDEDGWTYQVVVTLGTGTITGYSLTEKPAAMSISAAGLITWSIIPDVLAVHDVTVRVDASDGEFATETFSIEVKEPVPPVVVPLTADFEYGDFSYPGVGFTYVKGYTDPDFDCVDVTVTLSEALEEGETLWIRWQDEDGAVGPGVAPSFGTYGWVEMELVGGVYEYCLPFENPDGWEDCELICVEVAKVTPSEFCPTCPSELTIIDSDLVKVDSAAPVVDLNIIFDDCIEGICPPVNSISFTFEPDATGDICDPGICCVEECSGIAFWSIEDITDPCDYCPALTGTGCPEDTYECGCLLCSDSVTPMEYVLYFTFADNVGNEFVDTWTIRVDSDCAVTYFASAVMGEEVLPTEVVDDDTVYTVYKLYEYCEEPELL